MPDKPTPPNVDQVDADAELAAMFFRALVGKGMTVHVATSLTQTYLQSHIIARVAGEEPPPPWNIP